MTGNTHQPTLACDVSQTRPNQVKRLRLAAHQQQDRAQRDRAHAGPDGDVYRLLVLDRQLDRPQLGLVRVLGVRESAIQQTQAAGHDQYDTQHFDCVHFIFSDRDALDSRHGRRVAGLTACVTCCIALPSMLQLRTIPDLLQAPALDDTQQDHHDRDDQENVNEPAHGV